MSPTYDRWSVEVRRRNIDRYSADSLSHDLLTIDRLSTDYRPLYRPSVDRLPTAISTAISVETTYSKQDPLSLAERWTITEIRQQSNSVLTYSLLTDVLPL